MHAFDSTAIELTNVITKKKYPEKLRLGNIGMRNKTGNSFFRLMLSISHLLNLQDFINIKGID